MITPKRRLTFALLAAFASLAAAADESYRGLCDASAAVALGQGHWGVADDETDVLRIYQHGTALPVGSVDLVDYLRNRKPSGKSSEADIEGAALIGQRIYWISSHARKGKDGKVDQHRQRFFATDLTSDAPVPAVKPAAGAAYETLLDELLADPRFALLSEAAKRKPEETGGLNIEGLAASADGGLLIGFRNPLLQGNALIVPLRNPREIIDSGARPLFGDPIRLDLGGRGIRSLERVGDEVLIAAGPYGSAASSKLRPAFALFRWSGVAGQAPSFVRTLDAGSFRPEALFFDAERNQLVLFSDDGDEQVDGVDCKKKSIAADSKRFRSRSIALPPATEAARKADGR